MDCNWIAGYAEGDVVGDQLPGARHAKALMEEKLWLNTTSPDMLPRWAKDEFQIFEKSQLVRETSFGLIADWYRSVLQGKISLFDENADLTIAQMDSKLWGDDDEGVDAIEVMDRVAELARWGRLAEVEVRTDLKTLEELEISKIIDIDGLEHWLKDKPPEWAQAIALRAALCVAPLVFDGIKYNAKSGELFASIAVDAFRACFVGLVIRKEALSLGYIANAARNSATSSMKTDKGAPLFAGNAAYAAAAALAPNYNTSYGLDASFLRGKDPDDLTKPPQTRKLASDAVTHALLVEPQILDAVRADCNWLDEQTKNLTLEPGFPFSLLRRPLWMRDSSAGQKQENYLPDSIRQALDNLEDFPVVHESSLGLILDWYHSVYGSQTQTFSKLGRDADIAIATQTNEFWEGDPVEVMDKVAEIAGWSREEDDGVTGDADVEVRDFFISYSSKDEVAARFVGSVLEEAGYSIFAQYKDMPPGSVFVEEMKRGLASTSRFIPLYSPNYEKSEHCQVEWNSAYRADPGGYGRKMMPFMLKPTALNELAAGVVYCSLVNIEDDERRTKILQALEDSRKPSIREHAARIVSPTIVVDNENRLNTQPTPDFDRPIADVELATLPAQLIKRIDSLLEQLGHGNSTAILRGELKSYRDELEQNGVSPELGTLKDCAFIIRGAIADKDACLWYTGSVKDAYDLILNKHELIIAHYPLDAEREGLFQNAEINLETIKSDNMLKALKEFEDAALQTHKEDKATEQYSETVKRQHTKALELKRLREVGTPLVVDDIFLTEEDRIIRTQREKRSAVQTAAIADKTIQVGANISTISNSEIGKALLAAAKKVAELIWS